MDIGGILMDNRIRLDVNPMMAEYVGEHGIARAELDAMLPALKKAHAMVEAGRGKGMQGWMDLPYNQDDILTRIEATAARVRARFDATVSSLAALSAAARAASARCMEMTTPATPATITAAQIAIIETIFEFIT